MILVSTDLANHRLKRAHWSNASPIRAIFLQAFGRAGLPYFNPHSLRKTLVQLGEARCTTPEQLKAWSQNLGHEDVLTTLRSYGAVGNRRQGELIRTLTDATHVPAVNPDAIARAVVRHLNVGSG